MELFRVDRLTAGEVPLAPERGEEYEYDGVGGQRRMNVHPLTSLPARLILNEWLWISILAAHNMKTDPLKPKPKVRLRLAPPRAITFSLNSLRSGLLRPNPPQPKGHCIRHAAKPLPPAKL